MLLIVKKQFNLTLLQAHPRARWTGRCGKCGRSTSATWQTFSQVQPWTAWFSLDWSGHCGPLFYMRDACCSVNIDLIDQGICNKLDKMSLGQNKSALKHKKTVLCCLIPKLIMKKKVLFLESYQFVKIVSINGCVQKNCSSSSSHLRLAPRVSWSL